LDFNAIFLTVNLLNTNTCGIQDPNFISPQFRQLFYLWVFFISVYFKTLAFEQE